MIFCKNKIEKGLYQIVRINPVIATYDHNSRKAQELYILYDMKPLERSRCMTVDRALIVNSSITGSLVIAYLTDLITVEC